MTFTSDQLHECSVLYHLEGQRQEKIAEHLGVSRATVSRMLTEARARGIVRIQVVAATDGEWTDTRALCDRLGLEEVRVTPPGGGASGTLAFAPIVADMLRHAGLVAGDALMVTSGRTIWQVASSPQLPELPGVLVLPALGGLDERQSWLQTNEIARTLAMRIDGVPRFLYAPAVVGEDIVAALRRDPGVRQVTDRWRSARVSLVGIGTAPAARYAMPGFLAGAGPWLARAVGDVNSRFYDYQGHGVRFPGESRLLGATVADLRRVPVSIAVAAGPSKVLSIIGAARARLFNRLVTDAETAHSLLGHLEEHG